MDLHLLKILALWALIGAAALSLAYCAVQQTGRQQNNQTKPTDLGGHQLQTW